MMSEKKAVCFQCGRSSDEVPLLQFEYQGKTFFMCAQDLPALIHKPATLADKFPGAENWALKGSAGHGH